MGQNETALRAYEKQQDSADLYYARIEEEKARLLAGEMNPFLRENVEEGLGQLHDYAVAEVADLWSKGDFVKSGAIIRRHVLEYWDDLATTKATNIVDNAACPHCLGRGCRHCFKLDE